ncbi:MAG TPA: Gfo/Idh/MocA family oxidoreductase [Rhodothermales bacterium]|nr:Gfo/Idh/MocA family oxidoreductase [Rhodothermales bacterium]
MFDDKTSRRDFIKTTVAGVAGAGLAMSMPAYSYDRILGANDRVRVGIVGYSHRGAGSLYPAFLQHNKELNMEIVGVSDIWNERRELGAAELSQKTGNKVVAYRNNDELYDSRTTDAVIISTADFQHAQHTVQAIKAGQDVYSEKPWAHNIEDARLGLETVENSDHVFTVGTQRRSARNYQLANDYIKSGKFGDIVAVEMTWNVNQPDRWRRLSEAARIKKDDVDWDRYLLHDLIPGRYEDTWDPRKYLEFRLFWPYSSGIPDQWMVHQIDTVHWFTDLPHPRSVVANGGIYLWNDGRRNWDTMTAVMDYGPADDPNKGFQVVYSSRQTNSAGDVKEIYYSNGGTLNLDTNTISPEGGLEAGHAEKMGMEANLLPEMKLAAAGGMVTAADTGADNATSSNVRNWMESIRSRKTPNADIRAAYNHSIALIMTIAAIQTGKRVTFDDAGQNIVVS